MAFGKFRCAVTCTVQAIAGLTGARLSRFNVAKQATGRFAAILKGVLTRNEHNTPTSQARDYDPEGAFTRLWVPEVEQLTAAQVLG